jgi:uridine kinase
VFCFQWIPTIDKLRIIYLNTSEEERKKLSEYNFDHPKAFDFDLLYNHLCQLTNRQEIQMPIYNFTYSKREDKTHTVRPANVLIFEGILAFYDNVKRINFRE